MLIHTGVPTREQVLSVFPSAERLAKGPVAVIECFQRIPCNPCQTACRRGAIEAFADISDLPRIDGEKCNGCGLCVSKCPGLAIMVVDMTYSEDKALIKLPYEFAPLPEEGDDVPALDREGKPVCCAEVVKVLNAPHMDKTPVVSLAVDKAFVYDVRHFRLSGTGVAEEPYGEEIPAEDISTVCRCNDLDAERIRELIGRGFTTVDEIKRVSRLGMGPCQGRNCIPLVMAELSRATGKAVADIGPGTYRPVTRSVPLGAVAAYKEDAHE